MTRAGTGSRTGAIRILFLGANPEGTTRLSLDREVREISARLRASPNSERFELMQEWAVRVGDLQAALLRHEPDIIHFSGHGTATSGQSHAGHRDVEPEGATTGSGALLVEDAAGGAAPIAPTALENLLQLVGGVRCVVLNACYSASQSDALRRQADCVIGMDDAIPDKAAIAFAWSFYQALGFGKSVQIAFELGKNQIALEGFADRATPLLVPRDGIVPAAIQLLVAPSGESSRVNHTARYWRYAVAAIAGTIAAVALALSMRKTEDPTPTLPPGMVWVAPTDVQLGTSAEVQQALRDTCRMQLSDAQCERLDRLHYWTRESPRRVHVAGFFLDTAEFTVDRFARWLQSQPDAHVHGDSIEVAGITVARADGLIVHDASGFRPRHGYAALSMVGVTWQGARRACEARGARLPTGSEWERTALGAGGVGFTWGTDPTLCVDAVLWRGSGGACPGPSQMEPSPGARDFTPEGIGNLIGNVREWTSDPGDEPGTYEIRGGSYQSPWLLSRPAGRLYLADSADDVGFRCAASAMKGNR